MWNYLFSFLLLLALLSCKETTPAAAEAVTDPVSTAFEDPPAWAAEAIWYQIFVERFRNGDPANDPAAEDIAGAYPGFVPENWAVTPWGQDWYQPDPFFASLEGRQDPGGNPIQSFGQKAQLRRYGGDLQGVSDQLDYLDSLGVTAIYFNPLNDAPSLHKYDARHWRHIDRNFGPDPKGDARMIAAETPDDPTTWQFTTADRQFLELVEALHQRGIKVILDYSWNHTGDTFWAVQDIKARRQQSPYWDWYWIEREDDPATPEDELRIQGWMGIAGLPEIRETKHQDHREGIRLFDGNVYSAAAKAHIFAVTRRWLDPNGDGDPSDGVDGYRLDVAAEVPLDFWREYRRVVRGINPEAYLIGELWWERWPDQLLHPAPALQGDVFDASMNYRWYKAARHFFNAAPAPMPVSAFVDSLNALMKGIRPQNNAAMMNLGASHDAPRMTTSFFNRNKYKYNCSPGADPSYKIHRPDAAAFERLLLLLVHQYTYIGAPHIWAGDEMGMWGADDPDCRKPLIWPDLSFEPERAHPLGLQRPVDEVRFNQALYDFYRKLIHIRKSRPALVHGTLDYLVVDDEQGLLAYRRQWEGEEVVVVFNNSREERVFQNPKAGPHQDLLTGERFAEAAVAMPSWSARILVSGKE